MALDSYSYCPCGSGKKVKFCCAGEILPELEKCIRQIDGDQRVAALDQINRSLQAHPDTPCLLALKVNVLIGLHELEKAKETITEFLKRDPGNPVALAQCAILAVLEGNDLDSASVFLQTSLSRMGSVMMPEIYQAIGILAQAQMEAGKPEAAQPLLIMQAAVANGEDRMALATLAELAGAKQIPLLLRMEWRAEPAPEGKPWSKEYHEIEVIANQGCWGQGLSMLMELDQKHPGEPEIQKFLGVLSLWQGMRADAAKYFHAYAASKGIGFDDAVEAEALAQLLDELSPKSQIDVVTWIHEVSDAQAAMEKLLSDKRSLSMPVDLSKLSAEDEPPPKGVFWILDRPVPETGVGITLEAIPQVDGDIFVFGRQTDRAPRVELSTSKSANFERRIATVRDILGDVLVGQATEELSGHTTLEAELLSSNWRFPTDTPAETRANLLKEWRRLVLTEKWPALTRDTLDGKSPIEVKDDAAYKVKLAAAILLFETQLGVEGKSPETNELRSKLGLTDPEAITSQGLNVRSLSIIRLNRLDPKRLSDIDLTNAYQRARAYKLNEALVAFGEELLERSATEFDSRVMILADMAGSAPTSDKSLEYVERGRKLSNSKGQSIVTWLLLELSIRLSRREAQEADRILQILMTRHAEEPGVKHTVAQILQSHGIMPGGGGGRREPAPAMAAASPAAGLWTPESAAAEAKPAEKSKLWLPGMD
jgi:hypothetical protein